MGCTVATNRPIEPASVDRLWNSEGTGDNRTSLCQKESYFAHHKSYIHSVNTEFFSSVALVRTAWCLKAEILQMKPGSRDSSVGDMLDDRGTTVRCPKTVAHTVPGAHSTFYPKVSLGFGPGTEAVGAQNYRLSNAVSKKAWSYASITQMDPRCSTWAHV